MNEHVSQLCMRFLNLERQIECLKGSFQTLNAQTTTTLKKSFPGLLTVIRQFNSKKEGASLRLSELLYERMQLQQEIIASMMAEKAYIGYNWAPKLDDYGTVEFKIVDRHHIKYVMQPDLKLAS